MRHHLKLLSFVFLLLSAFGYAQGPAPGHIWPTSGVVTSTVHNPNHRPDHGGVDIASANGNSGSPILASAAGTVLSAGDAGGPGGIEVVIQHPDGTITIYSHLRDQPSVTPGQPVQQGQQIGVMGCTGRCSGNHLHYEMRAASGGPLMVNGQEWDDAAGVQNGQTITAGASTPGGSGTTGVTSAGMSEEQIAAEATRRCDEVKAERESAGQGLYDYPDELYQKCIQDEIAKIQQQQAQEVAIGNIPTGVPKELILENIMPTPEAWMDATNKLLDDYNIPNYAINLGIALLFAGFVYSLVSVMRAHASDQLFLLFGRLIIAAGLIFAAPSIRSGSQWIWTGAYDVMKANVVKPAVDSLQENLNDLYPLLASLTSISIASKFIAAIVPDIPFFDAGEEGLTTVGDLAEQSARGLFTAMVMLAGLYGVYFLAIYGSGMIMILAGTLVPLLMAFLVIPGMASWFSRWFAMAVTSLLMVIVFPILFSVIVTLGVNKPMESVNKELEGVQQTAQDFVRTLNSMPPLDLGNAWGVINWSKDALAQMAVIAWKLIFVAVPLTISILILVISVGASMYLMQQMPGLLSGFVGGTAGSAAHIPSAAAFAAGISAAANTATSGAIGAGGKAIGGAGKVGGALAGKASAAIDNWVKRQERPPSADPGGARAALPPAGGSSASKSSGGTSGNSQSSGSSGSSSRASASASESTASTSRLSAEESKSLQNDPNVVNVKSRSA